MVVPAGEERRPRRCTERRRVEPVVPEPVRRKSLRRPRVDRPSERAGRPEPDFIEDDQRRSGSIGGKDVSGSFASYVVSPVGCRSGIGRTSRPELSVTSFLLLRAGFFYARPSHLGPPGVAP